MPGDGDTIAAIATPPGQGAIAVVRVSGPLAAALGEAVTGQPPVPRRARLCSFRDEHGHVLDQGIALFFAAPASYTGEDVLELQGHGGRMAPVLLLERLLALGARAALPGEFTRRAYCNGKLDLPQAEAVADLIGSATAQAARSAARSLTGAFSRRIAGLLRGLVALRAAAEAALDFPEEETGDDDGAAALDSLCHEVQLLLRQARQGVMLADGLTLAIAGPPNAGKSTLLNALCQDERAIVAATPGTTRDPIHADVALHGLPLRLVDTAGLRGDDGDAIEREGMRRAHTAMAAADLLLWVRALNADGDLEQEQVAPPAVEGEVIEIINKIDLTGAAPQLREDVTPARVALSARSGAGLDLLRSLILRRSGFAEGNEDTLIARTRHVDALRRVLACLRRARDLPAELRAEELTLAQHALGEITGEFAGDDLLGEIFSRYCIGK